MAVGFVKQYTNGSSTAATAPTATTITAPASGNALVACVTIGSATANASVSSLATTGGTWTRVAQSGYNSTGTNRQEIWVCTGTSITGTSVAPTFSASSKYAINIQEWSGLTATVDVTAVTNTGSVTNATNTTTSTALSSPGGSLIIAAMSLATSKVSTDFSSTSGSPDARTALTYSAAGATTSSNVGMQAVYDISGKGFTSETFSWVTTAAWQYAWAAVTLHAKASTYDTTAPAISATVSMAHAIALARSAFAVTMTGLAGAITRSYGFARSSFAATCTATVSRATTALKALATSITALVEGPIVAPVRADTFTRADQSGWGTASDGHAWALLGNFGGGSSTPTLAISSNKGTFTASGISPRNFYALGAALTTADTDVVARISLGEVSSTNSVDGVIVRGIDGSNVYELSISGGAAGASKLRLATYVSGSNTSNTNVVFTPTAGQLYWLRLRVQGSTLQGRYWADADAEPRTWTVVTTNSGLASAGKVGVAMAVPGGSTNTVDAFAAGPPSGPTRTFAFARSALAATCTGTVSRAQQMAHGQTSSVPAAAVMGKDLFLALATFAASLAGTPALALQTLKVLAATISAAADLAIPRGTQYAQDLAASCTATVLVAWATAQTMAASCSGTVATAWQTTTARSSSIAGTTVTAQTTGKGLAASATALAEHARAMGKALAASCTGTVARTQDIARSMAASAAAAGAVAKGAGKTLAGQMRAASALPQRAAGKALDAALDLAAALRAGGRNLLDFAASMLLSAASGRATAHTSSASVAVAPLLQRTALRALAAILAATSQRTRDTARTLATQLGGSASLRRAASVLAAATLAGMGAAARRAGKALAAAGAPSGGLGPRAIGTALAGAVRPAGALRRALLRSLGATLAPGAALVRRTMRPLAVALAAMPAAVAQRRPFAPATHGMLAAARRLVGLVSAGRSTGSSGDARARRYSAERRPTAFRAQEEDGP